MDSLKGKLFSSWDKAKGKLVNFFGWLKSRCPYCQSKRQAQGIDLDKKLVVSLSKTKIPSPNQLKYIGRYLNTTERWIIRVCSLVILVSVIFLGTRFYLNHLMSVPIAGGQYIEGLSGAPQFINPFYSAANNVDSDLCRLIFSSLFKRNETGQLVGDLAVGYEVSEDGKIYTVKIRNDAKWQDSSLGQVSVDDVIFTFESIEDSDYHSPLRNSFFGVTAEKIDDNTIQFNLTEPYAAFPNLLTFGILPQEVWSQISPQSASLTELNIKPIGSGPYKFQTLTKDKLGNIKSYTLKANSNYYGSQPFIKDLIFKFYYGPQELVNALNANEIKGIDYLPNYEESKLAGRDGLNFFNLKLPQLTGIFFNLNNELLTDKKIRQALALALDKNKIATTAGYSSGEIINSPILSNNFAYDPEVKVYNFDPETVKQLLKDDGWKEGEISETQVQQAQVDQNSEDEKLKAEANDIISMGIGKWLYKDSGGQVSYLRISLTTVDNEDDVKVVEAVKQQWEAAGIKTDLNIVSPADIQSLILKPRNFVALYYGQILSADPDVYVYWHSSQAAKGLNITGYNNKSVDTLLEEGRITNDQTKRIEIYKKFQEIITNDLPAIFIFSPEYQYVQSKEVRGFNTKEIVTPSDRFNDISSWYIKTGKKLIW